MDNLPTTPTSIVNVATVTPTITDTALQFPTYWDDIEQTWSEYGKTWRETTDSTAVTNL